MITENCSATNRKCYLPQYDSQNAEQKQFQSIYQNTSHEGSSSHDRLWWVVASQQEAAFDMKEKRRRSIFSPVPKIQYHVFRPRILLAEVLFWNGVGALYLKVDQDFTPSVSPKNECAALRPFNAIQRLQ